MYGEGIGRAFGVKGWDRHAVWMTRLESFGIAAQHTLLSDRWHTSNKATL